jgi:ABC-type uncharacterized transport system substrate-binding protein
MTNVRGQRSDVSKSTALSTLFFALCPSGALVVALCSSVPAQQPEKIHWIGYLAGAGSSPNQAFVQGMREFGYVEGTNVAFVYRTTEGRTERYSDIVAELTRLKLDIIVTDTTDAAAALKKATNTIPIVMMSSTDPVQAGLIASLARPGGNVTGLTNVGGELGGKLLELLKEITPHVTRVAILSTPGGPAGSDAVFTKGAEAAAQGMAVHLIRVGVQSPEDIEGAFGRISKERANGLLMRLQPSVFSAHYKRVAELTVSGHLPSISINKSWVDAGGLMSYGPNTSEMYRRAASYVDKILKGVKPGELPVERPVKFELAFNLKTAKQIGLTIPQSVLYRADKVIK